MLLLRLTIERQINKIATQTKPLLSKTARIADRAKSRGPTGGLSGDQLPAAVCTQNRRTPAPGEAGQSRPLRNHGPHPSTISRSTQMASHAIKGREAQPVPPDGRAHQALSLVSVVAP